MNPIIHHNDRGALTDEQYVYCGRGSYWGNPHPTGRTCPRCRFVHTRTSAILAFRQDWYANTVEARQRRARALQDLPGKVLGCWCKSKRYPTTPCHLDVIAEFLHRASVPVTTT